MSASRKNESKTKIPVDENVDSGFLSGPLDMYSGELEPEPEPQPAAAAEPQAKPKTDQTVLCDSGVITHEELDSGICDTISECLASVQISDSSTTPGTHGTDQFVCTVTSPDASSIPYAHLVIFFQPDDDGDTQLHIASIHGCEKSVSTLIRICPNKALLDLTNDHGHTPLHLAVMSGNAVVARMLVLAGLSLGVRDRTGETPLHKATSSGRFDCLQALLPLVPEHTSNLTSILNQKNYNGQACVHLAASSGNLEALQLLVHHGADINSKENCAGWTALHIAARRGDERMVQYLRPRAAPLPDYGGRTPRRLARHTPAAALFNNDDGSDDDDDSDDDVDV
ncbi:NF-kappa-B inhibitor cactus-like isoform X2 [Anticarsia gemmatalis]|uniref:NF-kappa-B inhibitor cactus-like isoform X2 n=1 Tax=Anticarsia gemmatalis TaxID=129554 RepID=UPI003F767904